MQPRVLLVMPNKEDRVSLTKLFKRRGMRVDEAESPKKLDKLAKKKKFRPKLAIIDLHLPEERWLEALQKIRQLSPETSLLFAADRSDPSLIMRAKSLGAKNFLRAPYSEEGLQHALKRMEELDENKTARVREKIPKIRTPIRVKIILPYIIMAIIIGVGAAFVINGSARNSAEERFLNQLIDTGKLSADWMVREEERLLGTLRLLANTQGMADAISRGDTESLRQLALPIAVNNQEESIEILNAEGIGLMGIRWDLEMEKFLYTAGEDTFSNLEFVKAIVDGQSDSVGDKFAGLLQASETAYFYVSGPVRDQLGNLVGIILVGNSTYSMARQIREDTLAQVTLYSNEGQLLASTLIESEDTSTALTKDETLDILAGKEEAILIRGITSSSESYRELLSAWEARGGEDLGLIGSSLSETKLIISGETDSVQIFLMLSLAFFVVIVMGLLVANRISRPLMEVVEASMEVSRGNFDVRLRLNGDDEISVLAHSFNRMVVGLKDGMLYRNLLGRTVSPEIRDQLRANLASGDLQIQGQFAIATILIVDIHDFTRISETEDPTTIMNWLNELFSELVPIITSNDGVVNNISGDSLFAFFGILPRPQEAAESSYLACRAAVEMLEAVERINWRREERGDSALKVGIGINTGPVTAGGLGAEDRLHYTVIGDAVNTAQRIEGLAHEFEESAVMISKQSLIAMWDRREAFNIESRGSYALKGKREELTVYRLWPERVALVTEVELDLDVIGG